MRRNHSRRRRLNRSRPFREWRTTSSLGCTTSLALALAATGSCHHRRCRGRGRRNLRRRRWNYLPQQLSRIRRNPQPLPLCQITRPRCSPARPPSQTGRPPQQLSRMRRNPRPLSLCPIRCPLHLPPPLKQIGQRPNNHPERLIRLRHRELRSREPIFQTDFKSLV
jgi:hypothetical protein